MTRDERSPISDQGSPAELLRNLSPAAFAALGAEGLAYIKPVDVDGECQFEIHLADGRVIATMARRDIAEEVVRQNELEPVSVH
ncbi:MAG: DUF1150 family protein [Alphaproteobacteria bacterium]